MDVIERLNRKFGAWYEGLFGTSSDRDLRPRDILHRLVSAMEDARREGLDGQVYVPNVYTLQIAVSDEDERDYLRTFLNAEDLASAVQRTIEQHGYKVKGALSFQIEEVEETPVDTRVRIRTRFDSSVPSTPAPVAAAAGRSASPSRAVRDVEDEDDEEPGTVAVMPERVLASLVTRGPDGRLQDVYPIGAAMTSLGRGRKAGNTIVLSGDSMISKRHASLRYDSARDGFFLRDEASTNGTYLNETLLNRGEERRLGPGDQIRLGGTVLIYRPTDESPSEKRTLPFRSAPPAAGHGGVTLDAPWVLTGTSGESFILAPDMIVGRAVTADLTLPGEGIAPQHARLFRQRTSSNGEEYRFYVEDLGGEGGTFVNQERIPVRFPVALYENDEICFGSLCLRLRRRPPSGQRG